MGIKYEHAVNTNNKLMQEILLGGKKIDERGKKNENKEKMKTENSNPAKNMGWRVGYKLLDGKITLHNFGGGKNMGY